jgi:hypothetical protein
MHADIAALASRYLVLCTPCLFLTTAMECTRRYLQAQRAVKPTMAVGEASRCLTAVANGLGMSTVARCVHSSIVLSLCTRRYLQAQRAVKPTMAVGEASS